MKKELSPIKQALERLDTINQARVMYCVLEMPAPAIAKELCVNVKTIYGWRDKYDWEIERTSSYVYSHNQIITLLADINKVEDVNIRFSLLSNLMKGGKL